MLQGVTGSKCGLMSHGAILFWRAAGSRPNPASVTSDVDVHPGQYSSVKVCLFFMQSYKMHPASNSFSRQVRLRLADAYRMPS